MSRDKKIELLIQDGCTKTEAEKHLADGSIIFEDFEEHFNDYMAEWAISEEECLKYKKMIANKVPLTDWGIVEDDGKTYYIAYVL